MFDKRIGVQLRTPATLIKVLIRLSGNLRVRSTHKMNMAVFVNNPKEARDEHIGSFQTVATL